MGDKVHLSHVDGMRGLAALYVLACHAWLTVWPLFLGHAPSGWVLQTTGWLFYGHYGVIVFFVLSGYCLMLPVVRSGRGMEGGAGRFFLKRIKRIFPPYYFALALSLALVLLWIGEPTGTQWDSSLPLTRLGLFSHLFMLQDAIRPAEINYALWSIAAEWHVYLFFPFLLYFFSSVKAGPLKLCAAMLLLICPIAWWSAKLPWPLVTMGVIFLHYVFLFTLGMLGAWISFSSDALAASIRNRVTFGWLTLVFGAMVVVATHLAPMEFKPGSYLNLDVLVGLCTCALLVRATAPAPTRWTAILGWKPLAFIGGFSYSLYLIHAPLLQLLWQFGLIPTKWGELPAFLFLLIPGGLAICAVSYLFFLCFERPFLNTKPLPTLPTGKRGEEIQ